MLVLTITLKTVVIIKIPIGLAAPKHASLVSVVDPVRLNVSKISAMRVST